MKILLIEPNVSGHHISLYLTPLIDSLLKKKNKITIIVSKLLKKNKNFRSLKKNSNIKFLFIDSYENDHRKNFLSLMSKQVKYYYAFKRCFKKIKDKPDYIAKIDDHRNKSHQPQQSDLYFLFFLQIPKKKPKKIFH